jgi:hypothetical protein
MAAQIVPLSRLPSEYTLLEQLALSPHWTSPSENQPV